MKKTNKNTLFSILPDKLWLSYSKRYVAILYDFSVAYLAFIFSVYIRYGNFQKVISADIFEYALIYSLIQIIVLISFGLYKGIWRFASLHDLKRILQASLVAVAIGALVLFLLDRLETIYRSTFIINWFVLVIFLGMGRFTYRLYKDKRRFIKRNGSAKRTLIVGAGLAASQLIREISYNETLALNVMGLVDDDSGKKGKTLFGFPILANTINIPRLVRKYNIETLIIAIPSATSEQMRRIIKSCVDTGIEFRTLPNLATLVDGKVSFEQIRPVTPEDLLGREPVKINNKEISKLIKDKIALVTGAGGSIGSELTRQIISYKPREIILFDNCEFFLFKIEKELMELKDNTKVRIVTVLGDVRNPEKIKKIFEKHRPQIVLHAAAYKHVPMMESAPYEALQNNVIGTYNLIEQCIKHSIDKVVIISTDKAVNPTNVMGASKRLSEIVARSLSSNQRTNQNKNQSDGHLTKIITVRFGNVLGSNGSVIPIFKQQISKGGPVTVTHDAITRYFMSIKEASHLVLEAATMGKSDEIFVLDMGEPVRILDLAKEMIALSGFVPDKDIKIQITGLRPGEKLHEELLASSENTLSTHHPKILIARSIHQKPQVYQSIINWIKNISPYDFDEDLKLKIKSFVPEYQPEFDTLETDKNNIVLNSEKIVKLPK